MSKASKREILGVSTMSHKFQVTIPKKVRDKKGLKGGDMITFIEEDGRVYVVKSTDV